MGRSYLPDMYTRARGRTAPEGECRHIRQVMTAHVTYVIAICLEYENNSSM